MDTTRTYRGRRLLYRVAALSWLAAVLACSSGSDEVTWSEHIAPIVYRECTPCHRPGHAGPFSLMTYADASRRAQLLAAVTESRFMPPWPADVSYREFVGQRHLTADEIALFRRWAEQNAPLGDSTLAPKPPTYPEGSMLGTPDAVVKIDRPVQIPGNNQEHFWIVKIPFELPEATYLKAVEYVPGHRRLVHHMNGHLINYEDGKKKTVYGGGRHIDPDRVGYVAGYKQLDLANDDGSFPPLTTSVMNYLPGMQPVVYPKGIGGWPIARKGVFLLRDIHYAPSPIDTEDAASLNLFFSKTPPERPTMEIQLGTLGISEIVPPLIIPPDTVMTFRTRATVREDISLLTLNPHMHLLGKWFLAYALTPQGDTIRLVRIPKWDFRWQYNYTFPSMVKLPAGSTVYVEGVFDNTRNNPNNPFDPPQTVREPEGNMRTTDEMFQLIITYLPYRPGDEKIRLDDK
jgi:hypothetical protein